MIFSSLFSSSNLLILSHLLLWEWWWCPWLLPNMMSFPTFFTSTFLRSLLGKNNYYLLFCKIFNKSSWGICERKNAVVLGKRIVIRPRKIRINNQSPIRKMLGDRDTTKSHVHGDIGAICIEDPDFRIIFSTHGVLFQFCLQVPINLSLSLFDWLHPLKLAMMRRIRIPSDNPLLIRGFFLFVSSSTDL